MDHLNARGIGTLIHYPLSIPSQPAFSNLNPRACPVADLVASEVCSLPLHPHLSDRDLEAVATAVVEWRGAASGARATT